MRSTLRAIWLLVPDPFSEQPHTPILKRDKALDTNRPLRPRLPLGAILTLALLASVVVPQMGPQAWAQNDTSTRQDPIVSETPDIAQQTRETKAKSAPLEDRLDRLEKDVRELKQLMQTLAGSAIDKKASDAQPDQGELLAEVRRMDLTLANRTGEIVLTSPIKSRSRAGADTSITRLIADGSRVKKGDVVVELDSEKLQASLESLTIQKQRARVESLQAAADFEREKIQMETTFAEHRLQLELAELELKTYLEGTYPFEAQKFKARVQVAESALEIARERSTTGQQTLGAVIKAENELSIAKSDFDRLERYQRALEIRRFQGAVMLAKARFVGVHRDLEDLIKSGKAAQAATEQALSLAEGKFKSAQKQVDQLKMKAPIDGTVRYSSRFIKQGARVRERQPILSITPASGEKENVLKDVLVIPNEAVHSRGDQTLCFVKTPDGIEKRIVQLGQFNRSFVNVLDGLQEGETVLLGRVSLTEDSDRGLADPTSPRRER